MGVPPRVFAGLESAAKNWMDAERIKIIRRYDASYGAFGAVIDSYIVNKIMGTTLSVGDRAERTIGSIVSANYFDALGVHPILGRGFEPGEDSGRNAHPVTVISYQLWKGRFNGDPQIIGKMQQLNGVPHTIIGVAPEGFYGTFVGWGMHFWVPASMEEIFEAGGYKLEDRGATPIIV